MIFKDKYGHGVTAASQNSVNILDKFGEALLGFSNNADCIVELADTDLDCPLAQAYAAQFFASGETMKNLETAQKYLKNALKLYAKSLPREQLAITAAKHWCKLERGKVGSVLESLLDENSSDIISAKWAQAAHFDTGNSVGILRAPLKVARRHHDNAYLQGMLAFGYEECHMLGEAEKAANRAIEIKRKEPWAHHALAHIHEGRNTVRDGLDFMLSISDTWTELSSFMVTHNWWHTALFYIDLGETEEALALLDKQVWAYDHNCVQDQINAISLLYRIERLGMDVGNRWNVIAQAVKANSSSQVSVFLDIQFLYALARVGSEEAGLMQLRIIDRAMTASQDERGAWEKVGRYFAPAVVDLAQGNFRRATENFSLGLPQLQMIGGSHAQRDLFALFYTDALRGSGEWNKVRELVAARYQARPFVPWIKHQFSEAMENLNLDLRHS